jgi:hypothetical protein
LVKKSDLGKNKFPRINLEAIDFSIKKLSSIILKGESRIFQYSKIKTFKKILSNHTVNFSFMWKFTVFKI